MNQIFRPKISRVWTMKLYTRSGGAANEHFVRLFFSIFDFVGLFRRSFAYNLFLRGSSREYLSFYIFGALVKIVACHGSLHNQRAFSGNFGRLLFIPCVSYWILFCFQPFVFCESDAYATLNSCKLFSLIRKSETTSGRRRKRVIELTPLFTFSCRFVMFLKEAAGRCRRNCWDFSLKLALFAYMLEELSFWSFASVWIYIPSSRPNCTTRL